MSAARIAAIALREMRRIAIAIGLIAIGLGSVSTVAGCGGHEQAQETTSATEEATEVTVESAPGDRPTSERTEVTVESAETPERSSEE